MNKKKKDTEGFWQQYLRRYDIVYTQRGGKDVEHRISTSRFIISLYVAGLVLVVIVLHSIEAIDAWLC